MLLHNFPPICYGWGLAVSRRSRKAYRHTHKVLLFFSYFRACGEIQESDLPFVFLFAVLLDIWKSLFSRASVDHLLTVFHFYGDTAITTDHNQCGRWKKNNIIV